MTTLVLNFGRTVAASNSWTAIEFFYVGMAGIEDSFLEIGFNGIEHPFRIRITMAEFLALIADGGKIVDLRKLQQETNR